MTEHLCRCGRPLRDVATTCQTCGDQLARSLSEVPWLTEELDISTTRQQGIDYRRVGNSGKGAKKPSERPSPVSWGPSEARTHLKALLVSWVLLCASDGVRHREATDRLPDDNLPALSRWLLSRVDGLLLHDAGSDAVDEITHAVTRCHRLIDRPADRQYLGACGLCTQGRLYSRPGSQWATCESCDTAQDAEQIRARLLNELKDRLCTASEIARLSTYLGLQADREQVRKRINQWATRKLLEKHASIADETTFVFGEAYELLARADYGDPLKDMQEPA